MEKRLMKIMVFQQNGSAESKVEGIRRFGRDLCELKMISIDVPLPPVLDTGEAYLPARIDADLVLDHLKHPDLALDLAHLCAQSDIPMISSGKKIREPGVTCPPTCCGLSRSSAHGIYGSRFGAPELTVQTDGKKITGVQVKRGAPCGGTWQAAGRIIGCPIDQAAVRLGLEIQYCCTADPSDWDPIYGKSPVHFAGHIHRRAMETALAVSHQRSAVS